MVRHLISEVFNNISLVALNIMITLYMLTGSEKDIKYMLAWLIILIVGVY